MTMLVPKSENTNTTVYKALFVVTQIRYALPALAVVGVAGVLAGHIFLTILLIVALYVSGGFCHDELRNRQRERLFYTTPSSMLERIKELKTQALKFNQTDIHADLETTERAHYAILRAQGELQDEAATWIRSVNHAEHSKDGTYYGLDPQWAYHQELCGELHLLNYLYCPEEITYSCAHSRTSHSKTSTNQVPWGKLEKRRQLIFTHQKELNEAISTIEKNLRYWEELDSVMPMSLSADPSFRTPLPELEHMRRFTNTQKQNTQTTAELLTRHLSEPTP